MADDNHGRVEHLLGLVRSVVPPIHRGGWPIIAAAFGTTAVTRTVLRAVGRKSAARWATRTGLAAGTFTTAFFRAPTRVSPERDGVVVAPADGVVALIEEAAPPAELGLDAGPRLRVSIFLSVLDVHVQRIPMTGTVASIAYHPGAFFSADLDKASDAHARNSLVVPDGAREVVVTPIAGLIARRIVCTVASGAPVRIGDTYGLIRFGSRLDTYLPLGTPVRVLLGQRTIGGETVIAELDSPSPGGQG